MARSFGNKKTWDTPFPELIRRYGAEADQAVFCSGHECHARCADVLDHAADDYDLVYLDPPYISAKGSGVDYLDYYHFLEGLSCPDRWSDRILDRYKHKPLAGKGESRWCDRRRIGDAFEQVIDHYGSTQLVVSYRSDGIPSVDEIAGYLTRAGKRVELVDAGKYTYALSRNRRSREAVLVGR